MAKLNVGFNFTQAHFDTIMRLIENQQDKPSQIYSIYGSPGKLNPFGSVRETYREATSEREMMVKWLTELHNRGVEINLTLNSLSISMYGSPVPSSLDEIAEDLVDFVDDHIFWVDNWIISHPGIIDLFHAKLPKEKIIVSTIMNVHTIPQMHWIRENWPNVIRVCPALERNRDFWWLREAQAIIPLELLANEFCSMGGVDCEGLYRQICYMTQSLKLEGWKARFKCMAQRKNNPMAWLQSRFILPQWMKKYTQETGVEHFKITGRTHGPEFLEYIASAYMKEEAEGNLLSLWGQLESTMPGINQVERQKLAEKELNIPIELLTNFRFMYCIPDTCGITCKKCKQIWENRNENR